ncbi:MAG: rubredoxin [Ruminococcus sp.]|nr:rubredoxin [Ruminococcus sp.]
MKPFLAFLDLALFFDPAEYDGVAFEDLPDDWKCPRCKQGKDKFNPA